MKIEFLGKTIKIKDTDAIIAVVADRQVRKGNFDLMNKNCASIAICILHRYFSEVYDSSYNDEEIEKMHLFNSHSKELAKLINETATQKFFN